MPTVDDLRNAIRVEVGRYERVESTAFTKEALAAIAEAVGADTTTPPKAAQRAAILRAVGADEGATAADADTAFRKAHLEAIADALGVDDA
jgi:hypothetical protein